jgi:NAD(P)-dependent dehydrogenase (short-subunit alcohol dehydrogenase family)
VSGRDETAARDVAGAIDGAVGIACDVSDLESVRALCGAAREQLGGIDILVNNAGVASRHAITRVTDEEWFESLAVNLTGPMYLVRELIPDMKAKGWGRIVNVTSVAGTHGVPGFAAYGAAKGGVVALTLTLALELEAFGIRVNALSPAALTDMLRQLPPALLDPMIEAGLPTVEQCAQAALALVVEDAPNGTVLAVNAS